MELSLLTCQARKEVLNMKHTDFRDGHLFVIRAKVAADSEMGFIKIAVTPELEELRRRSLRLAAGSDLPRLKCEQALDLYECGMNRQEIARHLELKAPARADRGRRLDAGQLVTQLICYARARRAKSQGVRVASPYLVHRSPQRRRRRSSEGKPHWTSIEPAHANTRTTAIYLEKGASAVNDADYEPVRTFISLRDLLL